MRETTKRQDGRNAGAHDPRLNGDLVLYPLDGEAVVFSETAQSLAGLNATAEFLVRRMQAGTPVAALAHALRSELGVPGPDAEGWVATTLEALGSHGLLNDDPPAARRSSSSDFEEAMARDRELVPPYQSFQPKCGAYYRLLNTRAMIRCSHLDQMRMVDAVIGHLRTDQPPAVELVIDIQGSSWGDRQMRSNIYCNRNPEAQAGRLSRLGPLVKSMLWMTAVNSYDFLMNLHAGVVVKDGFCVLLPAAAGSGKSSLTAALTHAGFDYYSDEVALVEPGSFQVPAVPLSVCVKSTGWDVMARYFPRLEDLPTHVRADGKIVRYVPPPASTAEKKPASATHIFFPRYSRGDTTAVLPLSRSAALGRLMDQCVALRHRLDRNNVRDMINWIAKIDCYSLSFSSLDEAVGSIEQTLGYK